LPRPFHCRSEFRRRIDTKKRKARDSNPQAARAAACFQDRFPGTDRRLVAAGCLPSASCGGRNRTCVTTVQSRQPVPAQAPPHRLFETRSSRKGSGFKGRPPTMSRSPISKECPVGVEPGTAAKRWSRQLGRLEPLPLGQGHVLKAEGVRVELTRLLRSTADHPADGAQAAAIAGWLALPFRRQSSGGRNRTSNLRLNRPPPYRLATPDYVSQDGRI
jgi:hypothetical protein